MAWLWRYETSDGAAADAPEAPLVESFPSQADAETWLGENFQEINDSGVAQVTLLEDDRKVYGPMGLTVD